MATASPESWTEQIGETAGVVWRTLEANGRISYAKLVKLTGMPRDSVMLALGWLAREDKLQFEDTNRGRLVGLR